MPQELLNPTDTRMLEIAEIAADLFSATTDDVCAAESFVDDVEADSLLTIELLAQLEKRYAIAISENALPRMVNLRETYAVVAEYAGW